MSIPTGKILKRIDQPELISVLTKDLSGTGLNSILLEVFSQKTASIHRLKGQL